MPAGRGSRTASRGRSAASTRIATKSRVYVAERLLHGSPPTGSGAPAGRPEPLRSGMSLRSQGTSVRIGGGSPAAAAGAARRLDRVAARASRVAAQRCRPASRRLDRSGRRPAGRGAYWPLPSKFGAVARLLDRRVEEVLVVRLRRWLKSSLMTTSPAGIRTSVTQRLKLLELRQRGRSGAVPGSSGCGRASCRETRPSSAAAASAMVWRSHGLPAAIVAGSSLTPGVSSRAKARSGGKASLSSASDGSRLLERRRQLGERRARGSAPRRRSAPAVIVEVGDQSSSARDSREASFAKTTPVSSIRPREVAGLLAEQRLVDDCELPCRRRRRS